MVAEKYISELAPQGAEFEATESEAFILTELGLARRSEPLVSPVTRDPEPEASGPSPSAAPSKRKQYKRRDLTAEGSE